MILDKYDGHVMSVINAKSILMLNCFYEKGKLVEKSGRKTTYLRSSCKGEYGGRVTI
jgi:hypothetical protein